MIAVQGIQQSRHFGVSYATVSNAAYYKAGSITKTADFHKFSYDSQSTCENRAYIPYYGQRFPPKAQ